MVEPGRQQSLGGSNFASLPHPCSTIASSTSTLARRLPPHARLPACLPAQLPACLPACSKLDALAGEYNHLLVTQLESQRQYYEGLMVRQAAEAEAELDVAGAAAAEAIAGAATARAAAAEAAAGAAAARAVAVEAERRRQQADSKLVGGRMGGVGSLCLPVIACRTVWCPPAQLLSA